MQKQDFGENGKPHKLDTVHKQKPCFARNKLQKGSRGGARMTVERFTTIFLLSLEVPRDIQCMCIHTLNNRTRLQGKRMAGKRSLVYEYYNIRYTDNIIWLSWTRFAAPPWQYIAGAYYNGIL